MRRDAEVGSDVVGHIPTHAPDKLIPDMMAMTDINDEPQSRSAIQGHPAVEDLRWHV
jgi:hypothetical protein